MAQTPVTPRASASLLLLKNAAAGEIEVLMIRRHANLSFMGEAWVFPGGSVDPEDGDDPSSEAAHRICALRETLEEASIELTDPDALVAYTRWITPEIVPVRFDTRFYLAAAPENAEATVDGTEIDDATWITPSAAVQAAESETMLMHFPTIKQLEPLVGIGSVESALDRFRDREITPVLPRVKLDGDQPLVLIPGDDGYDD